jgi:hypothetical protein
MGKLTLSAFLLATLIAVPIAQADMYQLLDDFNLYDAGSNPDGYSDGSTVGVAGNGTVLWIQQEGSFVTEGERAKPFGNAPAFNEFNNPENLDLEPGAKFKAFHDGTTTQTGVEQYIGAALGYSDTAPHIEVRITDLVGFGDFQAITVFYVDEFGNEGDWPGMINPDLTNNNVWLLDSSVQQATVATVINEATNELFVSVDTNMDGTPEMTSTWENVPAEVLEVNKSLGMVGVGPGVTMDDYSNYIPEPTTGILLVMLAGGILRRRTRIGL